MNRIYRTVWNYATQSLVVVSELAKSNKKASAGNNVSEVCAVNSLSKSKLLAIGIVMSASLVSGTQALAANVIHGNEGCVYNKTAESVICGDASTTVEDTIDAQYSWNNQAKQARSVVVGQQSTSVGESNVVIGTAAKAEQFTQPGVKINTPSNAVHQLGTTYKPQASIAIGDGAVVRHGNTIAIGDDATANSFRDIAIGMQAGLNSKNAGSVGNNILMGSQAGQNIQSHNLVAIGTNAGSGLGNKIGSDTAFVHSNVAIGVNANSAAAVKVAATSTTGLSGVSANADSIIANNTVAIGNLSLASQSGSTSVGYYARTTGATATTLGYYSAASGSNSLVAGSKAFTSGESAIAFGHLANAQENGNKVAYLASGDQSIAVGYNTRTPALRSIAIGSNAQSTLDDSVALGAGSKTDAAAVPTNTATINGVTYSGFAGNNPTSVVSFGSAGNERQLKNVAAGVVSATSTDAINGSQLYMAMAEAAKPLSFSADSGAVVTPRPAGTVSINGDNRNITTKTTPTGVQVALNNIIDVGGVNTDFVAINQGANLYNNLFNLYGAPISNLSSGFPIDPSTGLPYTSLVAVNQAISDGILDPSVLKNGVNLGDLQQQADINVEINNNIFGKDNDGNPYVNKNGTITSAGRAALRTYNATDRGTQERNGIFNAIKNMNEQGIKFFHTNDGLVRAERDGLSQDDSAANAAYSTAIGYRAEVERNATGALAIGNGAVAKSAGSVALGELSEAGEAHVAAGTPESAYSVNAQSEDAVAAKATAATKVVSVGKAGAERQIQNVAAGVVSATSTDAVNGSQLYQTNKAVAANTKAIEKLRGDVHNMDRKLRAGIAGAVATAGLPQAYTPGKNMVAAAGGTYKGETAIALGVSRISDNGKVVLKLTGNANSRGDLGASVGAGYQW